MTRKSLSLRWPLTIQPLLLQFAILFISFPIMVALATRVDSGGPYTDETITKTIAEAIDRDEHGRLFLIMNPTMVQLKAETPNLWFMAEDDAGNRLSFGSVPEPYAGLTGIFRHLSYGHLRDRIPPHSLSAVIRRESSPAGPLTIMGHGASLLLQSTTETPDRRTVNEPLISF